MPSRLLIVDDMPLITSTITHIVQRQGLAFETIVEASSGLEAIEQARILQPDIAIIDIRMPGMDGLEAAAIIKHEQPKIRIVFLTAYDEFSYVQKALQLGARDYLLKPVRPNQLTSLLDQLLLEIEQEQQREESELKQTLRPDTLPVSTKREPVKRAVAFIQQHYDQPDISLEDVAKAAYLSASHLAYLFKQELGISYKQYLTAQRIDSAKRLLSTTDWTVDTIAEHVGYPNVTNFYRLFQRETGMTPATYRKTENEQSNS